MAEVRVLQDGIQAAAVAGYMNILIEGDNQMIVQGLLGKHPVPWHISNLIKDVQSTSNLFQQVQFSHIFREANMAADWLSKYGHSCHLVIEAATPLPMALQKIVWDDRTGQAFVRKDI